MVNVPVLEKEISVEEIGSHFFRNIHNQVKDQLGKVVRDAVVTLPSTFNKDDEEIVKKRIVESAQAGGIRIKGFIRDSAACLMAHKLDSKEVDSGKTIVLDLGWSKCEVSLYSVSGGVFVQLGSMLSSEIGGEMFVKCMVEHCAKDFTRKTKCPFPEYSSNNKAVIRLRKECENAMKSLSVGQEAMIDIDSLYEGCDYQSKISRARYEDLISIPFIKMKKMITELVTKDGGKVEEIMRVIVAGGPCSMPKIATTVKSMFTNAIFPKGKFEQQESQCIGAALHGKSLSQLGLLNKAPQSSPTTPCLTRPIQISAGANTDPMTALSAKCVLPARRCIPGVISDDGKAYLSILLGPNNDVDPATQIGEIVCNVDADQPKEVFINVSVAVEGDILVEIEQKATKIILATLTIPK